MVMVLMMKMDVLNGIDNLHFVLINVVLARCLGITLFKFFSSFKKKEQRKRKNCQFAREIQAPKKPNSPYKNLPFFKFAQVTFPAEP